MVGTSTRRLLFPALATLALVACDDEGDPSAVDAGADIADAADAGGDATPDATPDAAPDVAPDSAGELDTTDVIVAPEPSWCTGTTQHVWDPVAAAELELFPDGTQLGPDATSPTGERFDYDLAGTPWIAGIPDIFARAVRAVNLRSGAGTLGGVLVRFSAPVTDLPVSFEQSLGSTGWMLVDLDASPPERIPFEAQVLEEGLSAVLWPGRPLQRNRLHAFVVTTDAVADDGICIAPAAATRAMLHGTPEDPRLARHTARYREAIATLGLEPADISVLSVYRTHDDIGAMQRAAADVLTRDVAWTSRAGCVDGEWGPVCAATTTVLDYRNEGRVVDDTVDPVEAEIPVTIWLPAEGSGPFPTIVFGHGLNDGREGGRDIVERLAPFGYAIVAMDAVEHGDHPGIAEGDTAEPALRFLGIDLQAVEIDGERIRGNFDQTNLDRLRLIRLLRADPDIDDDGEADLDATRIAYVGASLGALCGTGLVALSPDLDAAIFTIGGARLLSIVTDSELLSSFEPVISAVFGSRAGFDRFVPLAQHLVDPSDPGVWAPHLIDDRLDDRTPPSLLMTVGTSDEVVPPASGRMLARSVGAPHIAPVAEEIGLIDVVDDLPVSGNVGGGDRTAGFFQYDRVTRRDRIVPATHVDTAKGDENMLQIRRFLEGWSAGLVPEIIDPYAELGTGPLP
jgi:dienelactone hydrolase